MPKTQKRTYIDLLIRVYPQKDSEDYYPVEARLSNGSHFPGGELHLANDTLQANDNDPQQYGLDLFYMLFSGKMREAYDIAIGLVLKTIDQFGLGSFVHFTQSFIIRELLSFR